MDTGIMQERIGERRRQFRLPTIFPTEDCDAQGFHGPVKICG